MSERKGNVRLQGVVKKHGETTVLHGVDLEIRAGEFFVLLGPSGSGKTTTLRIMAGLESVSAGQVLMDDVDVTGAEPGARDVAMVFQSYALYPHMTVAENIGFPLKMVGTARDAVAKAVDDAAARVSIGHLLQRRPGQLSGGQQQRVALARAIVRQPKLLLLDEPLSNLDATLRDEMRAELKRLQQQVGITTIYVTHDQSEALEMSDLVAVIDKGNVVQMGPPREIYNRPSSAFVAGFVGTTNLVRGKVSRETDANGLGAVVIEGNQDIECVFQERLAVGQEIAVSIRPEAMDLMPVSAPARPGINRLKGTVTLAGFLGNMIRYNVKVGERGFQINAGPETTFDIGSEVFLEFPASAALGVPWEKTVALQAAAQ